VNTLNTVDPLGDPSLDHAVAPPDANRSWLPLDTAVKVVRETPLPHVNSPPLTPQLPFEEVMVKLSVVPDKCMVASVWVDHVPRVRIPPPEDASMNAVAGSVPGVPVGPVTGVVVVPVPGVVVETGVPVFGRYLIPEVPQDPLSGALIGTNVPSITLPIKWK